MCGRFTLTTTPQDLQTAFSWLSIPPGAVSPRYNIAPTQPIAVVANNGQKEPRLFHLGLDPFLGKRPWHREPNDQCPRRDPGGETRLSFSIPPPPMPDPLGWVLRMESNSWEKIQTADVHPP